MCVFFGSSERIGFVLDRVGFRSRIWPRFPIPRNPRLPGNAKTKEKRDGGARDTWNSRECAGAFLERLFLPRSNHISLDPLFVDPHAPPVSPIKPKKKKKCENIFSLKSIRNKQIKINVTKQILLMLRVRNICERYNHF